VRPRVVRRDPSRWLATATTTATPAITAATAAPDGAGGQAQYRHDARQKPQARSHIKVTASPAAGNPHAKTLWPQSRDLCPCRHDAALAGTMP
jgi:hypothetical protein